MMEAVRSLGLAARFVSGYLYATPGPIPPRSVGPRLLRVGVPYALACVVGLGGVLDAPRPVWVADFGTRREAAVVRCHAW